TEAEAALAVLNRSLAAEPDFRAARRGIKGVPQALLYLDTGALAVAAYDLLIPVAQIAARTPQVDVSSLPTSDLLFQTLGGTVFAFSTNADGVAAEGYSPAGGISLLMMAPVAWQANRMANRGGGGPGPRAAGRQQQVAEELGRSLRLYAQENGGKYPAALQDMPPKYLGNLGDLGTIVYRGKQDAANKVLAHSSEKLPGPITILTQDGTVAQIRRPQLGKVLQEGFKGDALPGPPAKGEAVKPPRPPEF
ncbi:MAG: hypothetical protein NTW87_28510, partial [Planctomycetota bacterium]|nr:hypothetical protein [Planctomycetota bacterium]